MKGSPAIMTVRGPALKADRLGPAGRGSRRSAELASAGEAGPEARRGQRPALGVEFVLEGSPR